MIMRLLVLSLCCLLPGLPAAADDTLVIRDAWVREGPPTSRVLAGYMQIENATERDVAITQVSSPLFDRVEIHRTEVVDGVASMLPQDHLSVPAGGSVRLEPGGLHLMLIGPTQALAADAKVGLRLELDDGRCSWVEAVVKRADDTDMDHSHHHHHH